MKTALLATGLIPLAIFFTAAKKQIAPVQIPRAQENVIYPGLTNKVNTSFKAGEVLTYRLHYGFIDAGVAVLEVKPQTMTISGRKLYHIVGSGYTKGSFDWFFKVRDRYETYLDSSALVPWRFVRSVDEGGYKFNQDYIFNRHTNKVDVGNNETFAIRDETQDMVSSFYAARNIDFSKAKEGDIFIVDSFLDKESWPMKIKFAGRETIKSDIGRVRCIKFRPVVQKGRIFKKEEDLTIWITDDANHIPVRGEAKILVGSIKLDLTKVSNNIAPINFEKK